MVIPEIRFDRVTIFVEGEKEILAGGMVTLDEDGNVFIEVTGDVSSSWIRHHTIKMSGWRLVDITPWSMQFKANREYGPSIKEVHVLCEFNMFFSVTAKSLHCKEAKEPRISGNRKCEICGERKSFTHFHNRDTCEECTNEALTAYWSVRELVTGDGNESRMFLMPSKSAYMHDYLERKKFDREQEKEVESKR